jgi:hypothetical protein
MLLAIGVFVGVGAPLVYAVWRFINEALLGVLDAPSGVIALLGLVCLFLLLRRVAGQIRIWEER